MPDYYSHQKRDRPRYDLDALRAQVQGIYLHFEGLGYFAEYFGTRCDDAPDNHRVGKAGHDIAAYVFAHTERDDIYPINPSGRAAPEAPWLSKNPWNEDQVLDAIQFLATIISKPTRTEQHDFYGHTHYHAFDHNAGLYEYRTRINKVLSNYGDGPGWTLGPEPNLAIHTLTPSGLEPLVAAAPNESLDPDSRSRVREAVNNFRARGATMAAKRDAVTALGGILEKYKDEARDLFSNSTFSSVFSLLNNFGLRHNNDKQLTNYGDVELDAMFYYTLNLVQLLARKQEEQRRQQGMPLSTVTQTATIVEPRPGQF